MPQRPPLAQKIIFALGQLGWSLAAFGAANLLVYFYMPGEDGATTTFPTFIFQGAILGVLTVIGLVNFGGRIFDAFTDPLIAGWSDRSESSFGKRRRLMAIAIVPFALFSFLIFYPPFDGITANSIYLGASIFLFYLFMTLYLVPYNALISELGHHPADRMSISTIISVTFALGIILGSNTYLIQSILEQSMSPTVAFQTTMGIFAVVSAFFMLIPVLFLKENKYCKQGINDIPIKESVKQVFKNKNFRYFTLADLMYWLALTFIQIGISYYIILLMGLDKKYASMFFNVAFPISFLLYIPINLLVKKIGKKRLLLLAFITFSILFGLTALMDKIPLPKMTLFYFLAALSAFPLASFGIIPNAIIADIVHQHEAQTGESQAGMFYAVRNLMMKLGISIANLIFPSLLLLGKSLDNPMGVRVSACCAFIFCVFGYLVFLKYDDVTSNPV